MGTTTVRSLASTILLLAALGVGCAAPAFEPEIPELGPPPLGLQEVAAPADNPMTPEKVALGWQLYYDPRLSVDGTVSCATCHAPDAGFADPKPVSTGVDGLRGGRNSPTVINAAYQAMQFWDGRAATLEEQALGPIENPVEMANTLENVVTTLNAIPGYRQQFRDVFGAQEVTAEDIGKAIASFERAVLAGDSPWDRWYWGGDATAVSEAVKRGDALFRGEAGCSQCHVGTHFTDAPFGLYHNIGVAMEVEDCDTGRHGVTGDPGHYGAFKTPTLRNATQTAPYMHDGSLTTLEEVIDYYDRGGVAHDALDPKMKALGLTDQEKADLLAFLRALEGEVPAWTKRTPPLPPGRGGK